MAAGKDDYIRRIQAEVDDSDDEDYITPNAAELLSAQERFERLNPNLDYNVFVTSLACENIGRAIIYSKEARELYLEKKATLLAEGPEFYQYLEQFDFVEIVIKKAQETGIGKFTYDLDQLTIDQLRANLTALPKEKLIKLSLAQSNNEVLTKEFKTVLAPLTDHYARIKKDYDTRLPNPDISVYKLTGEKILKVDGIKTKLTTKMNDDLKQLREEYKANMDNIASDNIKYFLKIKEICGGYYPDSDSIHNYVKGKKEKLHATALSNLVKKTLDHEIENSFENGFRDKPRGSVLGTKLLNDALVQADTERRFSITDCTKAKADTAPKVKSDDYYREKVAEEFTETFAKSLKVAINRQARRILPLYYVDPTPIRNSVDFHAREQLAQRSAIRRSRNEVSQEFSRTTVFDITKDTSVQVDQTVRPQSQATNGSKFRGTNQETVLNLGNYDEVLTKIKSIGEFNFPTVKVVLNDACTAAMIRAVYKNGSKGLDILTFAFNGVNQEPLSKYVTADQLRNTAALVQLFFGTEGSRSPAAITEANMGIDLIISGHKSWDQLLTGKDTIGKGGELSFTMKSAEGAGGIECGRRLTQDASKAQPEMVKHKYGGEPIAGNSVGYQEYLNRKDAVFNSWAQKVHGIPDPSKISPEEKLSKMKDASVGWTK